MVFDKQFKGHYIYQIPARKAVFFKEKQKYFFDSFDF